MTRAALIRLAVGAALAPLAKLAPAAAQPPTKLVLHPSPATIRQILDDIDKRLAETHRYAAWRRANYTITDLSEPIRMDVKGFSFTRRPA